MNENPVIDQNGVWHPSQTACAEANGVTVSAVTYHLTTYGNLDRMCGVQGHVYGSQATMKPVEVNGRSWESRSHLARDLGESRSTICRWLRPDASRRCKARLHHRVAMLGVEQ